MRAQGVGCDLKESEEQYTQAEPELGVHGLHSLGLQWQNAKCILMQCELQELKKATICMSVIYPIKKKSHGFQGRVYKIEILAMGLESVAEKTQNTMKVLGKSIDLEGRKMNLHIQNY
jgi:hypothetical protein